MGMPLPAAGHLDVVNLMPATSMQFFVKSNALLVTLARTKVLPYTLMWSNVLPAIFVQTKRVACPLGGCDVRDDLLVDECGRRLLCG